MYTLKTCASYFRAVTLPYLHVHSVDLSDLFLNTCLEDYICMYALSTCPSHFQAVMLYHDCRYDGITQSGRLFVGVQSTNMTSDFGKRVFAGFFFLGLKL